MTETLTADHPNTALSHPPGSANPTYIVPNAWEHARRRLDLLEASYDPTSFSRATALGVGEGWRCLDAGAGGGSFARWLGACVGATGSVVATDVDTRLLDNIKAPNVEVHQMDLVTDEMPTGEFDFIHTRWVLLHIPARERVLDRLCAALRPGGVLLVEEGDAFPVLAAATGAYRDAWLSFNRASRVAGTDPDWARDLPLRLARRGLTDIHAEVDVHLFRGGSTEAQFWSLTWKQARDRVVAVGEPGEVIDRGQADLDDEQRWFPAPANVIAWGRRQPA